MKKINASSFLTYGYCEYKFFLNKVKNIILPRTTLMMEGSLIHEEKESEFLKEAEITTWDEFLKSEELTITKEVFLEKDIGDFLLSGKIDEISVDSNEINIIEDKPNAYPYDSVKLQTFAYCFLFKENFNNLNKKIYAVIRDRDTNLIVWKNEFTKELENLFFTNFYRMRNILLQKEEPIPTTNSNKCKSCQYNQICEFSLVK